MLEGICQAGPHLTKLEHLDINSLLLQVCQLGLCRSLVFHQLSVLVPELALCGFQLVPVCCQLLQSQTALVGNPHTCS